MSDYQLVPSLLCYLGEWGISGLCPPLALTAGAPAEQVFTHKASLAEKPRVSQGRRRTSKQLEAKRWSIGQLVSVRSLSYSLSICGLIWILFYFWSCPRCWNMNQSAGAVQHTRRYSVEGKVSKDWDGANSFFFISSMLPDWGCIWYSSHCGLTTRLRNTHRTFIWKFAAAWISYGNLKSSHVEKVESHLNDTESRCHLVWYLQAEFRDMIGSCVPLVQTPCWINELTKKQDKWLLGCIHLIKWFMGV